MNDLKINGKNGYDEFGVRMGKGFINTLEAALELKAPIENDSRIEDGVRMVVPLKKTKRTLNLTFNIHGSTEERYLANKKKFEEELYKGLVDIQIMGRNEIYHLVYTGKSVSYNHSYSGVFGICVYGFIEPNPANRTAEANENVMVIE